jgi:serine/threonine protein kinase
MVTPDGRVKMLDFGIAASLQNPADDETTRAATREGGTPGTLVYMAPEVLNGEPASGLSDIWSLGVLLYEMIAAHLPFAGKTPAATASALTWHDQGVTIRHSSEVRHAQAPAIIPPRRCRHRTVLRWLR